MRALRSRRTRCPNAFGAIHTLSPPRLQKAQAIRFETDSLLSESLLPAPLLPSTALIIHCARLTRHTFKRAILHRRSFKSKLISAMPIAITLGPRQRNSTQPFSRVPSLAIKFVRCILSNHIHGRASTTFKPDQTPCTNCLYTFFALA